MFGGDLCCRLCCSLCNALPRLLARISALLCPTRPGAAIRTYYPIFPAETWAAIAAHLHAPADLAALAQTCRALRATAQVRLFARVDLLEMRNLEVFRATLQRDCAARGPLGRYVRLLRVMVYPPGAECTETLRGVLAHCGANLRVLSLPNWTARLPATVELPRLSSLEVRVDEAVDQGVNGPWFMPLLRAAPGLRVLRVWGTVALPAGVAPGLTVFTGDLASAAAAIAGRPVQRVHLIEPVDVDHAAFQLHVDEERDDPILELLLRPTSGEPSEYLSALSNGFPHLQRLIVLGTPRKFIDEVIRGASDFPKWESLRELVMYCDDEDGGLELEEPAFAHCLLRDHRGLRSVSLRSALPYDLCLPDVMQLPEY